MASSRVCSEKLQYILEIFKNKEAASFYFTITIKKVVFIATNT